VIIGTVRQRYLFVILFDDTAYFTITRVTVIAIFRMRAIHRFDRIVQTNRLIDSIH